MSAVSSNHDVPFELIKRYDKPGPRYTSYPTAPEWKPMGDSDARAAYEQMAKNDNPVSIYVHIPFCDRMCLFCGCNVIVARSQKKVPRYLDALEAELKMVREIVGPKKMLQLHFGGGTPTFLEPKDIARLGKILLETFPATEDAEISMEVDPMVTSREHLQTLIDIGFNRVSMGVQDFSDEIQEVTERLQPDSKTTEVFENARAVGFESINVDLMYGLPLQTPAHLAHSVKRTIELGADRVTTFGYAHVPWMKPHQKKLESSGLPGGEERWQMFNAARSALMDAGYKAIGMDHFAKPSDELALAAGKHRLNRNFQGYTVLETTDVIGLGVSAIGDVGGAFIQNTKGLTGYYDAIESGSFAIEKGLMMDDEDHLRRSVIMQVMCNLHIDFAPISETYGIKFEEHFASELEKLQPFVDDDIVILHEGGFSVTERGRVFVRNVAMTFDSYLGKAKKGDGPRFSRTV